MGARQMNKKEKAAVVWVVYLLALALTGGYSFAHNPTDWKFGAALVGGLFGLGWFACRLDLEHQKSKGPANAATKMPAPDKEEEKWRSYLHKKEPWER